MRGNRDSFFLVMVTMMVSVFIVAGCIGNDENGAIVTEGDVDILTKIGGWGTGFYHDVALGGNYAYCAASGAGLDIIDIANTSNPRRILTVPLPEAAYGVVVCDPLVAVLSWSSLFLIDISDPLSAEYISTIGFGQNSVNSCAFQDHYLYTIGSGLQIIDISAPRSPVKRGSLPNLRGDDIAVQGSIACVASNAPALRIIDVSDPDHPVIITTIDEDWHHEGRSVVLEGDTLYFTMTDYSNSKYGVLDIYNLANPAEPQLIAHQSFAFAPNDLHVTNMTFPNNSNNHKIYIYVPSENDYTVVMTLMYDHYVSIVDYIPFGMKIDSHDAFFVLTDRRGALKMLEYEFDNYYYELGRIDEGGTAYSCDVSGGYACIADGVAGVRVLDIADASDVQQVGLYDNWSAGLFSDVSFSNGYAYVIGKYSGVYVLDCRNPAYPILVDSALFSLTSLPYRYSFNDIDKYDSYLYISYEDRFTGGIKVFDVSDPSILDPKNDISNPGAARRFAILGHYLYLSTSGSMRVYDLSTPDTPQLANTIANMEFTDIAARHPYLYLATAYNLRVVDVSDPINPIEISDLHTGGYHTQRSITLTDHYALISKSGPRILVIDIRDPLQPMLAATYDSPGNLFDAVFVDGFLVSAQGDSGKTVLYRIHE